MIAVKALRATGIGRVMAEMFVRTFYRAFEVGRATLVIFLVFRRSIFENTTSGAVKG